LLHGSSGLLQGFADEIQGVGGGLESLLSGRGFRSGYESQRDSLRQELKDTQESNPVISGISEAGGSIASMLAGPLGVAKGAGLAATVGKSALAGGLSGAGRSESDLLEGDFGGLAKDVGIGGGIGGFAGGIGYGIGKGLEGIRSFAGKGAAKAAQRADDMALAKANEEAAGAWGGVGGETQKGSRFFENLAREADSMTPEQAARFARLSDDPAVMELRRQVIDNNLEALPGQAKKIADARAAAEALEAGKGARVAKLAEDMKGWEGAKDQLKVRLKRYLLPGLGTAVGTAIGGPVGGAIGSLAGAGTRPMMRSMMNLATKYPAVQIAGFKGIGGLAGGTGGGVGRLAASGERAIEGQIAAKNYAKAFPHMSQQLASMDEDGDELAYRR
jgi:hypothetical protein